jgi:integrase
MAVVDAGRNPENGKRRRRTAKAKTKPEALRRLGELRGRVAAGDVGSSRFTVDDLLDRWLEHVRINRAPATWHSYRSKAKLFIRPAIGRKTVARLAAGDVQVMLDQMTAAGHGARDVQLTRATIRAALSWAVNLGYASVNVATRTTTPTVRRPRVEPFTPEECRAMVSVADRHRFGPFCVLAGATGLRPGELCALQWSDVQLDEERPYLVVAGAVRRAQHGYTLGAAKTPGSRRALPLPPVAVDALHTQRDAQAQARAAVGPMWTETGLVFTTETGALLDPLTPSKQFASFCQLAGVPYRRLYVLRHTVATLLLVAGTPMRVVQEVLGHSSMVLTADTYSHVTAGLRDEAAEAIQRVFQRDE